MQYIKNTLWFVFAFALIYCWCNAMHIVMAAEIVTANGHQLQDPVSQLLAWALPYAIAIAAGAIGVTITWVLWLCKKYLNISIDATHRDILKQWCIAQASNLIALGFAKMGEKGFVISVDRPMLRNLAQLAASEIPQVVDYFGLSSTRLAELIVAHLPHVPVAATIPPVIITEKSK